MLRQLLFAVACLPAVGCLGSRAICLPPDLAQACQECPGACRGDVVVVMLHGFDPCDAKALSPLRDALHCAGFGKTYYGHCYHVGDFAREVIEKRQCNPNLRVVVVGCGWGVESAFDFVDRVGQCGVDVATLVAIDAPWFTSMIHHCPPPVERFVCLRRSGALEWGPVLGEVVDVPASMWESLATHPDVYIGLVEELKAQADLIPAPRVTAKELCFGEPVPTPRLVAKHRGPADSWDFLQPAAKLRNPGDELNSAWTVAKPIK